MKKRNQSKKSRFIIMNTHYHTFIIHARILMQQMYISMMEQIILKYESHDIIFDSPQFASSSPFGQCIVPSHISDTAIQ